MRFLHLHSRSPLAPALTTFLLLLLSGPEMSRQKGSLFRGLDWIASNMSSATSSNGQQSHGAALDDFASRYFTIQVVDQDTNRGIPLVYLRTTYKTVYMTDSAGYVAFYEPELMNGDALWVAVSSYGFEPPRGFLGIAGMQIHPRSGHSTVIKLKRTQIAQRLYRLTGYGVYRDSVLLGKPAPIERPILNAKVAGSDTIQCAKFRGKLFWMWQDTDQMEHQLGNFKMTGATTDLPENLNPEMGLSFRYLTKHNDPNAFVRELAKIPLEKEGSFPLWIDGLTVVLDEQGREHLMGRYYAARFDLGCVEEGLTLWNDNEQVFGKLARFKKSDSLAPSGHTIYIEDQGTRYAYYGKNVRVKADLSSVKDPAQYEAFTCLTPDGKRAKRGPKGALLWSWVKGGKPVHFDNADNLVRSGIIRAEESPYRLKDVTTGQTVIASQVAIAWNPHLKLWLNIIQQKFGDTTAGEIWLSTANSPVGPWQHCVKVATHHMNEDTYKSNSNDFYNPVQHYELMREGGRFVYFSGTLTNTFSGNPWPTPLYNYNNIMYRLDLDDPRLGLPQPPPGLWLMRPDCF